MTAPILETSKLRIPRIGLGTWQLRGAEATAAVEGAIGFPCLDVHQLALREEVADGVGRLCALGEPVLHALFVDVNLLGGVLLNRVVPAEVLKNRAIATLALIDGGDTVEGTIGAAEPLHTNTNHGQNLSNSGLRGQADRARCLPWATIRWGSR